MKATTAPSKPMSSEKPGIDGNEEVIDQKLDIEVTPEVVTKHEPEVEMAEEQPKQQEDKEYISI